MTRSTRLVWGLALALGIGAAVAAATWLPPQSPREVPLPGALVRALEPSAGVTASSAWLTHPEMLWLVPLAAIPFLVVVLRQTLVDAPRVQIVAQFVARVLLLLAIALALTQPTLRAPLRGKTVVLAIDVSASIDDAQLASARDVVETALAHHAREVESGIPREDQTRLALVTYAGQAVVRTLQENATAAELVTRHDDDPWASDHAAALRVASALLDPQSDGRIVLVTDGGGSLAEREDLDRAVTALAGIDLHVRRFPPTAADDVLVQDVHLPAEMRLGETFEVAIDVLATRATHARLQLFQNGEPNALESVREVELREGAQQLKLPARVTEPGTVVFRASLDPEALDPAVNRRDGNDSAATVGSVRGRPRVLLVGSGGDAPLASALRADHLEVETIAAASIPQTVEALRAYDLVIVSDVTAGAVPPPAHAALRSYVEDHGGGFLMIGGEHAFGLGGWERSALEPILPVRFEGERQREQPMLALVLVIDKSGSMSSDDKLDLVKEAARATARTLEASDELGVIAFDSRPTTLVRLQPASNRIRIASDIRRLSSGGGTNALPALREAYLQLAGSSALIKHVILLSDGQSPENGIGALLGDMRDADITVSSVGVGAGAGKDLLRRIATRGRGRFYYSHDGTDVPRIFSRETNEVTRNAVQERLFYPRVVKNAQALRGIDFGGAPGLRGLVPVKPKARSEVLLTAQSGEPLLVRARRGLGRTAAFASDAKSRWASAWLPWSGFAKVWSQVARDTMRQGASLLGGASIQIAPSSDEGSFRVWVDVEAPQGFANDLVGRIEVLDPAAPPGTEPTSVPLQLSAPGRYEAELHAVAAGERLVTARLFDASQTPERLVAEAVAEVAVPYPAELLPEALLHGEETLRRLAVKSRDAPIEPILEAPGDPRGRTRNRPLWPYVLAFVVVPMLVLDLLLRRVSLGTRRVRI